MRARVALIELVLVFAAGCASVAPLAVKWGADLISAAVNNYPRPYSRELEALLLAMYSEQVAKKLPGVEVKGSAPRYPADGSPASVPVASRPGSALTLDATILAQRAGDRAARRTEPVPINDGDVLRDAGGDPRKGDIVKFSFRTNCDCFVYVIGVDATGYVSRVFPDDAGRPVRANQPYVVPQGTAWYGLDQHKGVEQVFFVASLRPRPDIEKSLRELAKTNRGSLSRDYRPVREPAVPDAATRGLVKVQPGTQSTVSSESGQLHSFTPQAFSASPGRDNVVVTRWFRHQ